MKLVIGVILMVLTVMVIANPVDVQQEFEDLPDELKKEILLREIIDRVKEKSKEASAVKDSAHNDDDDDDDEFLREMNKQEDEDDEDDDDSDEEFDAFLRDLEEEDAKNPDEDTPTKADEDVDEEAKKFLAEMNDEEESDKQN